MRLSISNLAWPAAWEPEIYMTVKELGFTGIEIAPTRLFPEEPYARLAEAESWAAGMGATWGLKVCSMQSIWYGRQERLFGREEERRFLLAYTKQAIDFAQAVGCGNLVFGCPRNRSLEPGEDAAVAIPFFEELGAYAQARGSVLALEANPPIYHTNFCNTTSQAIALAQAVNSPGFRINLDVGAMVENGEDTAELKGKLGLVSHVHISEPGLKPPARRSIHGELAGLLREEGYSGFVSIEMAAGESLSAIGAVCGYVREIFG